MFNPITPFAMKKLLTLVMVIKVTMAAGSPIMERIPADTCNTIAIIIHLRQDEASFRSFISVLI